MLRQKQGGGNGRHAMKNAFIQKNKKKKPVKPIFMCIQCVAKALAKISTYMFVYEN